MSQIETQVAPIEDKETKLAQIVEAVVRSGNHPVQWEESSLIIQFRKDIIALRDMVESFLAEPLPELIESEAEYIAASERLKRNNTILDVAQTLFDPYKKAAFQLHKRVTSFEAGFTNPLSTAKGKLVMVIGDFHRKQLDDQRRAQEQADEAARLRKLKEQEALTNKAATLEKKGDTEGAEKFAEKAAQVVAHAPIVTTTAPQVKGITPRKTWNIRVEDKIKFLTAALNDPNLLGYITINEGALKTTANRLKGEVKWPGVAVIEDVNISSRKG